jgi:general stress protein 26
MKTLLLAAAASVIAISAAQAQMPRTYPEAPPVPTRAYPGSQATEQLDVWQCGLIQVSPRERIEPDPGFKIDLTISDQDFHAAHTSISGVTRVRGEQYRNIRVWNNGNANWSGVSMRNPRLTMIGTFGKNHVTRRMQYVERLYRDGELQTTIVSTCHAQEGD